LDYLSAETLYATYNKYLADQITVCCQEPVSLIHFVGGERFEVVLHALEIALNFVVYMYGY
jgi:hypothetical protein